MFLFSPLKLLTLYHQEKGILLQGERWNPAKNERKFLKNNNKKKKKNGEVIREPGEIHRKQTNKTFKSTQDF